MTAALPSGPPPSTSLTPTPTPTALPAAPVDPAAALGRLSASGVALLQAGRTDEAVDVLRHAVAAAEPGAHDLLVRAHLNGGDWHAAVDLLSRLVAHGHVRFAGRLGVALAQSATWVGRRRRSASLWSTASWPRATTSPSCSPRKAGSTRQSRCSGVQRTRVIRRPRPTSSSCWSSTATCVPRCRSPSATRTSRAPTRSSRWPTCGPRRAVRTRPRGCTGGPCSWARCGRTPRSACSCSRC